MIMNYEDAERRLKIFERGRGGALVQLASHAALPVVLNADFVHLLRVNYFLDPPVTLPYTAEAERSFPRSAPKSTRACTSSTRNFATSSCGA